MTDPAMTREDVLRETEAVLRGVVTSDPYHQQFAPLLDTIDDLRTQLAAAQQERGEADEALAACRAQASGEIAVLSAQLEAMTEARDLWQREAEIQQKHRESAERELEEWREREAAVCPEDVGFDEYITALRHRAERLERVVEAARSIKEAVNIQYLDGEPSRIGHADSSLFVALDREIRRLDDASAGEPSDGR